MEHLGRLDALSTLTVRQRDDVARRYGDTDHLVVVPNPVELPPVPEPRPARPAGRIVVIARLHSQKRLDLAVDAFAVLARTHPGVHLDVYGSGPEREALERQVAGHDLGDRVTFHGHVARAADELWAADVAWLTSAFEGYSLFLLEARAARYSWYLRLPGPRAQPLSGIVRVELPALGGIADVVARADAVTRTLPRFASEAHKDPRAPHNLYPIAGLEQRLRHLLGNQLIVERGLRRAATAA
jgi:glycosyltransferase involved in cell wall biosynthesis